MSQFLEADKNTSQYTHLKWIFPIKLPRLQIHALLHSWNLAADSSTHYNSRQLTPADSTPTPSNVFYWHPKSVLQQPKNKFLWKLLSRRKFNSQQNFDNCCTKTGYIASTWNPNSPQFGATTTSAAQKYQCDPKQNSLVSSIAPQLATHG